MEVCAKMETEQPGMVLRSQTRVLQQAEQQQKQNEFKENQEVKAVEPKAKPKREVKPLQTNVKQTQGPKAKPKREVKPLQQQQTKPEQKQVYKPFIQFKGKVNYHTSAIDCALICDNLLEQAKKCEDDFMVIGFDMEWSFNYETGPGRTAVIQISPDLHICYILHVSKLNSLPKSLSEFLIHPKVRITGNNIKCDVRKLGRDFVGFNSDLMVQNCIDLGVMANTILPVRQRWSLEKLVDYVLQMKISKDNTVRMSSWHVVPLTARQQKYAAIDSYASLLLYVHLKQKQVLAEAEAME